MPLEPDTEVLIRSIALTLTATGRDRPPPAALVAGLAAEFHHAGNTPAAADADRVAALLEQARPYRLEPVPSLGHGVRTVIRRLLRLTVTDQRAVLLASFCVMIDPDRVNDLLRVGWVCVLSNRPGRHAAAAVRTLLAGIPGFDRWEIVRTQVARTAAGEHAARNALVALAGGDHGDVARRLVEAARRLNPKPETWGERHACSRLGLLIEAASHSAVAPGPMMAVGTNKQPMI